MSKEGDDMVIRDKSRRGEKTLQPRTAPPAANPWDEMERWFNEFGRRGWLHPLSWDWPGNMEVLAPF